MPSHDYSLTAKWNHFNIEYNLNGGENNKNNKDYYALGEDVPTLYNPTKKGYTFLGWKYNGNFVTSINITWLENITLDAIWEATTYDITYHLDGGDNATSNPKTYNIESEDITLASPTKKGYNFKGWYTSSTFDESTSITTISKGSSEDINLYAKWEIITYSITYNLNGGNDSNLNPKTYTVEDEITLVEPTKDGYTFLGWYNGDTKVTKIEKGTIGSISLTASYSANLNTLSVSSEDTSKGSVEVISGRGYTDEEITVKVTLNDGYYFKGWYEGDNEVSVEEEYTFKMPSTNKTLVAKFYSNDETDEMNKKLGKVPTVNGNTVTYGLYPQTIVSDTDLISKLDTLTTAENGWYYYDNAYYVKSTVTKYVASHWSESVDTYTFSDGSEVVTGDTRYFKCEPISWKVLTTSTAESGYTTYSLVSNILLDNKKYNENYSGQNEAGYYANNYEQSEIRSWLIGEFYNEAFNLNSSYLKKVTVDNSASTTLVSDNQYCCNDTEDYVYLLSDADYQNTSYGFNTETTSDKASLRCKVSDYCLAQSAYMNTGTYNGCSSYYTRSPIGSYSNQASFIYYYGAIFEGKAEDSTGIYPSYLVNRLNGVRPGITINIPLEN